jgi:hypothetical protein
MMPDASANVDSISPSQYRRHTAPSYVPVMCVQRPATRLLEDVVPIVDGLLKRYQETVSDVPFTPN